MSDLPARIVALATRVLHRDRREWAMAMAAELAQLRSGPARWKFALGCAHAALVAPRHPSAPTIHSGKPARHTRNNGVDMIAFSSRQHILSSGAGKLKTPAIISTLHVLPFMILELVNRRNLPEGFPIALFVFMWLLALTFGALLVPILRTPSTGNRTIPNPVSLLPRLVLLILISWVWVTLVVDQMPCFLGVPNCD